LLRRCVRKVGRSSRFGGGSSQRGEQGGHGNAYGLAYLPSAEAILLRTSLLLSRLRIICTIFIGFLRLFIRCDYALRPVLLTAHPGEKHSPSSMHSQHSPLLPAGTATKIHGDRHNQPGNAPSPIASVRPCGRLGLRSLSERSQPPPDGAIDFALATVGTNRSRTWGWKSL
jgi:hypothetical protein